MISFGQKKTVEREMYNFNFDNVNKKLYWQKVYDCGSYQDVFRLVSDIGCVINYSDSSRISGSTPMKNLQMPKGVKKNSEETYEGIYRPVYFEPCTIFFSIDIKDNRYRVTVTNIIWATRTSFMVMGVLMNPGNLDINEILVKKNGKLRSGLGYQNDFSLLNNCLDLVFNIKKNAISIVEKEW